MLREQTDPTRKLRAIWALHVTGGLTEDDLLQLLAAESDYVRSWAVTLAVEAKNPSAAMLRRFAGLAYADSSPLVRLALASALQRVPVASRWDILTGLLTHGEDATDQNLPLMYWYAAEPVVETGMSRALGLSVESRLAALFPFTVRRIAASGTQDALRVLADRLGRTDDVAQQKELANGIQTLVNRR